MKARTYFWLESKALGKAYAAVWICLSSSACGSAEAEKGPPPSLQKDVMPILQASCTFGSSCHGATTAAGYMQLGPTDSVSADQLMSTLVGTSSVTEPGMLRVAPGEPTNSFLLRKLLGDFSGLECGPSNCGMRMPYGAPPLPEETLETIERWVALGAPM